MKKLLSLMLVLAFCGFASAAVDIYVTDAQGNNEIMMNPSDTIELLIWYAGDPIVSFDTDVDIRGVGTITGQAVTATGRNTEYDFIWIPGINEGAEVEITGSADAAPGLTAGLANPLAKVIVHLNGPAYVDAIPVSLCDWNWNPIENATVHGMLLWTPEPTTIALLCLGGLILRKK